MTKVYYQSAINRHYKVILKNLKEARNIYNKNMDKDIYIGLLIIILHDIEQTAGDDSESFVSSYGGFSFLKNMLKLRILYRKVNKKIVEVSK